MDGSSSDSLSFGQRWKLAWSILFDATLAGRVSRALAAPAPVPAPKAPPAPPKAPELPPERVHASALALLGALQREGRLIDFLRQDVAGFSDEEIGAAARVVHGGCARVLQQGFDFEPAVKECEGEAIAVPVGFDAQRIRLTGNVTGQPPYRGTVRHHGWVARSIRVPSVSEALDPRVLAAAEVELP
ncbi:MAG: DUF2760 domain-containing protein [Verrucomicrobiales bacterium]|nr:DUF2760 domain-containing protein [Verrucomicrobiales bacterium]